MIQFNIQAPVYTTIGGYPRSPAFSVPWVYREHVIMKFVEAMMVDVYCMEEVEKVGVFVCLKWLIDCG